MILDELIVVLGIDNRSFKEGQRDALDAFRRTQQATEGLGKSVEASGAHISEAFGMVRKGLLGVIGGFIGGEAAAFIGNVIQMDAATGRFAKTMDSSVENLGVWQSMIRQVGGSAEDARSALGSMQNELNNVKQGGGLFSEGFGFLLNKIGGAQGKNSDQIMRELSSYFRGEISAGRETSGGAATYMRRIGINEPMIRLLLSDLRELEAKSNEVGTATKETADAAQKLATKFDLMTQAMERFGAKMIPILDLLSKPFKDITRDDISGAGGNDLFVRDGLMDRLDRAIWGDHNMADAKKRLAKGLGAIDPIVTDPNSAVFPKDRWGVFGSSSGGRAGASDREGWIRSMASMFGIDPDTAFAVARSEGFKDYSGDQGTSFGDFQLHQTPGGRGGAVGDAFRKQTGLDPSDPANERAMDEFALRWASTHGWGDFHGAARTGIGQWQGIGARATAASRGAGGGGNSSTSTSSTSIGKIEVHTQATDAAGIAADIGPAIKHSAITAPVNSGLM